MDARQIINRFLEQVFTGQLEQALEMVAEGAQFIATNPRPNASIALHGTFVGPEGAARFFGLFNDLLEPNEFNVLHNFSEKDHVALYGNLKHRSKVTRKDFISDWALICKVKDNKISLYHFYEDTQALLEALS